MLPKYLCAATESRTAINGSRVPFTTEVRGKLSLLRLYSSNSDTDQPDQLARGGADPTLMPKTCESSPIQRSLAGELAGGHTVMEQYPVKAGSSLLELHQLSMTGACWW